LNTTIRLDCCRLRRVSPLISDSTADFRPSEFVLVMKSLFIEGLVKR
jgi:hypothetical protein